MACLSFNIKTHSRRAEVSSADSNDMFDVFMFGADFVEKKSNFVCNLCVG